MSEFLIAPHESERARRHKYTFLKEYLGHTNYLNQGDVVQLITEPCLIATVRDVRELCKILRHQVRNHGPFVLTFEFPDEVA